MRGWMISPKEDTTRQVALVIKPSHYLSLPLVATIKILDLLPAMTNTSQVWQGKEFRISNYSKDNNEFGALDPKIYGEITHWADLPSPPNDCLEFSLYEVLDLVPLMKLSVRTVVGVVSTR